ncbi:MAG: N-acetylmuramoyl-L-alanine amidase [Rhodospirillaceae bacterium]|nr:N-acetylmuramoyl-L-alanine amidase [Rhodospirillaceae bacterium]
MPPTLIQAPSPNHDSRDGQAVDILLLHYTGMPSGEMALSRLRDPAAKVSAHYVVEEDGRVFHLVPEDRRAWHAGVSSWLGAANINQRSIGIEIVNPGHEFGYRAFPAAQMTAVLELSLGIITRHRIPAARVIGHSDVAPLRKEDPGELFDWQGLAAAGVGVWPSPKPVQWSDDAFFAALQRYGYETSDRAAATRAFCRHFRQGRLSDVPDAELAAILNGLLGR